MANGQAALRSQWPVATEDPNGQSQGSLAVGWLAAAGYVHKAGKCWLAGLVGAGWLAGCLAVADWLNGWPARAGAAAGKLGLASWSWLAGAGLSCDCEAGARTKFPAVAKFQLNWLLCVFLHLWCFCVAPCLE